MSTAQQDVLGYGVEGDDGGGRGREHDLNDLNLDLDHDHNHDLDHDPDALFAELENEDDSRFRTARLQELGREEVKGPTRTVEGDTVTKLQSDDEVLRYTTEVEKVVLHFLHPDFARCAVMDRHLESIAQAQCAARDVGATEVKWARVDVKDAPFVVEKMGIRVLPCVVGFRDGIAVGRVVGFEGLVWGGGTKEDSEDVARALEEKLVQWKMLGKAVVRTKDARESSDDEEDTERKGRGGIRGTNQRTNDEDEDDDWD